MTVNLRDPRELFGATVTGHQGVRLGKVVNVYLDDNTRCMEWAAVETGMRDGVVSLVPLATADYSRGILHLPYDNDQVHNAPHQDPGQELSVADEAQLFEYYGVAYEGDTATARSGHGQQGRPQRAGRRQGRERPGRQQQGRQQQAGPQQSGPRQGHQPGQVRDDRAGVGPDSFGPMDDGSMIRSEEQLRIGVESHESGRARLRKYVVTEYETVTVPVQHEEVRIEREPITDPHAATATSRADMHEEEHEVVLHTERPVVDKQTVAKERVRLNKHTHTKQEQVCGEVRKERIDTEGDTGRRRGQQQDHQQHDRSQSGTATGREEGSASR